MTAAVAGECFVVDVDDDGPGIDPTLGDQIFDPYVTTKRDGTGLGLSIVKKIVVDHGGATDVARSPLGGHGRLPRRGAPGRGEGGGGGRFAAVVREIDAVECARSNGGAPAIPRGQARSAGGASSALSCRR